MYSTMYYFYEGNSLMWLPVTKARQSYAIVLLCKALEVLLWIRTTFFLKFYSQTGPVILSSIKMSWSLYFGSSQIWREGQITSKMCKSSSSSFSSLSSKDLSIHVQLQSHHHNLDSRELAVLHCIHTMGLFENKSIFHVSLLTF